MNETYTRREQDSERFVVLLTAAQGEILRYILALVPEVNEAQEILQETAVALWRKFDRYDLGEPFVPLACRFAFHHVLKHRARKMRQARFLSIDLLEQLVADRREHEEYLESRRSALTLCLQGLSDDERALIELRYSRRTTVTEMAEVTGRNLHTLYKTLERVRGRLYECVTRRMSVEGLN